MNENYLLQHISRHLHTCARKYVSSSGQPESFCARADFSDGFTGPDLLKLFYHETDETFPVPFPVLFSVNDSCIYSLIPAAEEQFLIGPVRLPAPVPLKYRITAGDDDADHLRSVPVCELHDLITDMLLVYNLHCRDTINEADILLYNCGNPEIEERTQKLFSDLVFETQESGKPHNPYEQELREFSSIEEGNLDLLEKSLAEDYIGEVGTLAKNPLRHAKNCGIVVITLACRAAIRGGMAPEIAFSLSDSYILQIEECSGAPAISRLLYSAEFQYARLVRAIREQKSGAADRENNPYISRCKNYIFTHLHDRILVRDIADQLGIHPNYLSALFLRYEKIPLSDYIRKEKINLARNLLVYSRYSYSEIAGFLGFSSQSHLGKQFKMVTGMTLKQYRQLYGKSEPDSM